MTDEPRETRPGLQGAAVFLSASFPQRDRSQRYTRTAHPLEMTDAVKAVVRAVLSRDGRLVFGGHPSITPLVLEVGREVISDSQVGEPLVLLFQSKAFEDEIPKSTRTLSGYPWVELTEVRGSRDELGLSLARMRSQMIKETDPQAAIFIGGMEGIEDEWEIVREKFPHRPAFPIGSAGGAAQAILQGTEFKTDLTVDALSWGRYENLLTDLKESTSYAFLANRIVDTIAESIR